MIVRCEFKKHEPVRNVTALAVMWYCCNFLSSCRTDGMIGMGECHAAPGPGRTGYCGVWRKRMKLPSLLLSTGREPILRR